jgi:hypothetical protein
VTLQYELDGGRIFVFIVRVRNFLGQQSLAVQTTVTRQGTPVPTVTIDSEPFVRYRPNSLNTLTGSAFLASCFEGGSSSSDTSAYTMTFRWYASRTSVLPDAPVGTVPGPLALDERTRMLRDLVVRASTLTAGLRYTVEVHGCMQSAPTVCGVASVDVALRNAPLVAEIAGGDRGVSAASDFVVDGCVSEDPDDPNALLEFTWSCARISTSPSAPPASSASTIPSSVGAESATLDCGVTPPTDRALCGWTIPANTLVVGSYTMSLFVIKPRTGENATTSVRLDVEAAALVTVTIAPLQFAKQNPSTKLVLVGELSYASFMDAEDVAAVSSQTAIAWSLPSVGLDLSSPNVSATGANRLNLVILRNMLRAGGSYTFELSATLQGVRSRATARVLMNRPPYGGDMLVSVGETALTGSSGPSVWALETDVTLTMTQWVDDDPDDLPLTFAFSYQQTDVDPPVASTSTNEESQRQSLGQKSTASRSVWQKPPAGNFTLFGTATDAYNAPSTVSKTLFVQTQQLTAEREYAMYAYMQRNQARS